MEEIQQNKYTKQYDSLLSSLSSLVLVFVGSLRKNYMANGKTLDACHSLLLFISRHPCSALGPVLGFSCTGQKIAAS